MELDKLRLVGLTYNKTLATPYLCYSLVSPRQTKDSMEDNRSLTIPPRHPWADSAEHEYRHH